MRLFLDKRLLLLLFGNLVPVPVVVPVSGVHYRYPVLFIGK
jgi:hypothetical protein